MATLVDEQRAIFNPDQAAAFDTVLESVTNNQGVTNFIQPYLHQFFDNSHGLNGTRKPLRRPFDRYQSYLEEISNGQDIRQINW